MCQQLTGGSRLGFSRACSWLPREARMGSLHWFIAYAPARLLAMRCAAARMRCSLDSKAKSCTLSCKNFKASVKPTELTELPVWASGVVHARPDADHQVCRCMQTLVSNVSATTYADNLYLWTVPHAKIDTRPLSLGLA